MWIIGQTDVLKQLIKEKNGWRDKDKMYFKITDFLQNVYNVDKDISNLDWFIKVINNEVNSYWYYFGKDVFWKEQNKRF